MVEIVNPQDAVRGGGEGEGCTKPGGGVRDGVCVTCGVTVTVDQATWMQGGLASRGINRHGNAVELVDKEKELATERRQGAAMASITGEAIRQIGEERDAARNELAKTCAELDEAQARIDRTLAELTNPMWRGLLDDDVAKLVDEIVALLRAEANPATTAEPAAS